MRFDQVKNCKLASYFQDGDLKNVYLQKGLHSSRTSSMNKRFLLSGLHQTNRYVFLLYQEKTIFKTRTKD